MDIHIDISGTDAKFGLYAAAGYELTAGGLSLAMGAEQFQQLCDHLRPWIVEDATPPASVEREAVEALLCEWKDRADRLMALSNSERAQGYHSLSYANEVKARITTECGDQLRAALRAAPRGPGGDA